VKDAEIGFKGDFLDRRLRVNLAGFYVWRNGAQNIVNAFIGTSLTQFVQNAGKVRSKGIELETTAQPWEGMELNHRHQRRDRQGHRPQRRSGAPGAEVDGERGSDPAHSVLGW